MIGFDVSAVRAIIFTVVVYIGIGTPPILIEQTKQLIDSFPSSSGKTLTPIDMGILVTCNCLLA